MMLKNIALPRGTSKHDSAVAVQHQATNYLDQTVREQYPQVTLDIARDNEQLYTCHVPDAREPLIERRLEELMAFLDKASQSPRSALAEFPFHRYVDNRKDLVEGLALQECDGQMRRQLLDTQFKWARPMVDEWASVSSTSWGTLLDEFIFQEYEITLFQTGLFEFLSTYHQANNGRRTPKVLFRHHQNPDDESVAQFFYWLDQRIDRAVTGGFPGAEDMKFRFDNLQGTRQFRIKHFQKINRILETFSTPLAQTTVTHNEKTILKLSQPIMVLSDVLNAIPSNLSATEIQLNASVVLHMDCDLENTRFHGKNIGIVTPSIRIPDTVNRVEVNVSGLSNTVVPAHYEKAETGHDGEDGDHGLPGESGGNVYIKTGEIIGHTKLFIISNGGKGSDGGNGGDGGDGKNGADGKDGDPKSPGGVAYAVVDLGKPGEPGGIGGKGGGVGRGGHGGFEGLVRIEVSTDDCLVDVTTTLGQTGENGTQVGKGGAGGKPGKDGIDVLQYRQGIFGKTHRQKAQFAHATERGFNNHFFWFAAIGGLPAVAAIAIFGGVDLPDPIQSEEEFNTEQEQIRAQAQEKNKGTPGDRSAKRQVDAVRQSGIDITQTHQDFITQFQRSRNQNTGFVTSKMANFYQTLSNDTCETDIGPDAPFISKLKSLQLKTTLIQQRIQIQKQREQANEAELNYQRIIDAELSVDNSDDPPVSSLESTVSEPVSFYALRRDLIFKLSSVAETIVPTSLIERIIESFNRCAKYESTQMTPIDESLNPDPTAPTNTKKERNLDPVICDEALWIDAFCTGLCQVIQTTPGAIDTLIPNILSQDISTWITELAKHCDPGLEWGCGTDSSAVIVTADILQHAGFSLDAARAIVARLNALGCLGPNNKLDSEWRRQQCNPSRPTHHVVSDNPSFTREDCLKFLDHENNSQTDQAPSNPPTVEAQFNQLLETHRIVPVSGEVDRYRFADFQPTTDPQGPTAAIDPTEQFAEWIRTTLSLTEAVNVIKTEPAHCLLLYALAQYQRATPKHLVEPKSHFQTILLTLAKVKNVGPLVPTLLQIPVAKWPLTLETHGLREQLNHGFGPSHPDAEKTKVIVYLDRVEAQFGLVFRKKIERCILQKATVDATISHILVLLDRIVNETLTVTDVIFKELVDTPFSDWAAIKNTEPAYIESDAPRTLETLRQLILENPKNDGISDDDLNNLVEDIRQIRDTHRRYFSEKSAEQIRTMFLAEQSNIRACLNRGYSEMRTQPAFLNAMGMIIAAIQLNFGYIPRDTQLIAVLWGLCANGGSLLEVKTGEGKTATVIMTALLTAMAGRTVDIVTSSPVLAKRDAVECGHVAEIFGFTTGHNCDENSGLRQENYTKTIVYGDEGAFERDSLMDRFYAKAIRGNRTFDAVVIDEVDSMLLDKSDHMLYLSQAIPGIENLEGVYVNIWLAVQGADMATGSTDDIKKVNQFIRDRIENGEILYPNYLKAFVSERLETWIQSAFIARGALGKNDAYRVGTGGKNIVTMDKNTGVQLKDSHLSEGIHQFLQLKHLQKFKPETLKSIFVSNTTYFKKYKTISGLTGTLGSESERQLLTAEYGVTIGYIPTFKPRRYTQHPAIAAPTQAAQFEAILKSIQENQSQGRPVLIINDSIAMAKAVHDYLTTHQIKATLNTLDEEEIKDTMGAGEVVVSTNLSGRGTDKKISESISEAGGLHVIMTSCSSNIRTEKQGFGRSARSGQKGSGQFIVCAPGMDPLGAIDFLIFERNQNEKMRLAELKSYRLGQTKLEEGLLETFKKNVLDTIHHPDNVIKETLIESALTQFSFWLDSRRYDIKAVKDPGTDQPIFAALDAFIRNGSPKTIQNTVYYLLIGKHHLRHKAYSDAIACFERVITDEPEFSEWAEYYLAAALINQNPNQYEMAIQRMKRAKHKLNQRIYTLSNYPHVLQHVKELQMKSGEGTQTDLYEKQISDRLTVYQTILQSIRSACGESEFDVMGVSSTRLNDDQKEKIRHRLEKNPLLFTPIGLIEELGFTADSLQEKLKIPGYSAQLKTEIIQKLLENKSAITESIFTDMLGNVDDLFNRLIQSGIVELTELGAPKALGTLCSHPLRDYLLQVGDRLVIGFQCLTVKTVTDTECTVTRPKSGGISGEVLETIVYRKDGVFKRFNNKEMQLDVDQIRVWPAALDTEAFSDGFFELDTDGSTLAATFVGHRPTNTGHCFQLKAKAPDNTMYTVAVEFEFVTGRIQEAKINGNPLLSGNSIRYVPNMTYKARSVAPESLSTCFNNPEFQKRYHQIETIKSFLSDEIQKKEGEKRLFKKSDIQMLKQDAMVNKLIATLATQGVVHPPYLKETIDDATLNTIVKDAIAEIIKDGEVEKDIKTILSDAIKGLTGDIKTKYHDQTSEGPLQATLIDLSESLQDHFTFSLGEEIESLKPIGLDSVIKIENKPHWWGPLVVFLFGVVQIVAGAVCMVLGAPNVGMGLIAEGVGDIMFAVEAQISGNFSWKTYAQNKLVSLAVSILTCGVSAALCKGVQIAAAGVKTAIKKIGKKVLEGIVFGLSSVAIDSVINGLFNRIADDTHTHSKQKVGTAIGRIKEKLETLYKKTGDSAAVRAFMAKLERGYLNVNEITAKVSQYFHQVLGAIAGGMAQAVKLNKNNGAKFAALAASVKALEALIKSMKYVENIMKSLTEMARFISMVEQQIDIEIQLASTARENSTTTSDMSFIDDTVGQWEKMVTDHIISYMKDGILKPEIKGHVNRFLKEAGREIKNEVFKGMNFEDKKYNQRLKQARETNLTRLASKEAVFKDTSKSPATLLAENPTLKEITPQDHQLCANTDGHTVSELKRMIPGVMFFEKDGKLLFLPPHTFSGLMNDAASGMIYQGSRYQLTNDNSETIGDTEVGHRRPIVKRFNEHGQLVSTTAIDIPPIGDNKFYCDEQTRLFNDKLNRVKQKYPHESQDQWIARAKAYAQKEHKIVKLRAMALGHISEQVRHSEQLRGYVMGCSFGVGMFDPKNQKVSSLESLNGILGDKNRITEEDIAALKGANKALIDKAIQKSKLSVCEYTEKEIVIDSIREALKPLIQSEPIQLIYDDHGDKHFIAENQKPKQSNRTAGSKFNGKKEKINSTVEKIINQHLGTIRTSGKGNYYLICDPVDGSKTKTTVQVDYDGEKIGYHAYPDETMNGKPNGLRSTKNGDIIPNYNHEG